MARRGRVVTVWHGDRIVQVIQSEITRRLSAAARLVQSRAKVLVGKEGTGIMRQDDEAQAAGQKVRRRKGLADLDWRAVRKMVERGDIVRTPERNRATLVYGAFPSRPGDPPHKQTGRLQGSITSELRTGGWLRHKMSARIGTNLIYGRHLELGTRRMKARPWLRRALDEVRGAVRAVMSGPMRGGDRRGR